MNIIRRTSCLVLFSVLFLTLHVSFATQPQRTQRASVSSNGEGGNGLSSWPNSNVDGRVIVFQSYANNLVSGDTNDLSDIFVHDTQTGETTRVSVSSNGEQGNDKSQAPSISMDGRFVAFQSRAGNLVDGDTNGTYDIFVHDRQTHQTTRISIDSQGVQAGQESTLPSISGDGRYVAFASLAINLVPSDSNNAEDVFVHDRQTHETTRISVGPQGVPANDRSGQPSISADGRYVAFSSFATNLVPRDTNGMEDVFVHDRQTHETTRLSVDSQGSEANSLSDEPKISGNGQFVVFESYATNLVPGDTNARLDIFVHNRQTHETTRVSVGPQGVQGNNMSREPSISTGGDYVAFQSFATNLIPEDTNNVGDVFVYGLQTHQIQRVSVNASDAQRNGISGVPGISGDGRYVAFDADASNPADGDASGNKDDIFVGMVTPPDTSPPTPPAHLTANIANATNANLHWDPSTDDSGVASYRIYRNGIAVATVGNITSYVDSGLAVGNNYTYQTSALDSMGNESIQSSPVTVNLSRSDTTPPTAPTNLRTTIFNSVNVNLTWTASTDNVGVTRYSIYRNNAAHATIGNVTTYVDRGLARGTTYTYKIIAIDASGNASAASRTTTVTIPRASR